MEKIHKICNIFQLKSMAEYVALTHFIHMRFKFNLFWLSVVLQYYFLK